MATTDGIVRGLEDRAYKAAQKKLGPIAELYKAQLEKLGTLIDGLFSEILDAGSPEDISRSDLYKYAKHRAIEQALDAAAAAQRAAQNAAAEAAIRETYTMVLGQSFDSLVGKSPWNLVPDALIEQYLRINWSGERFSERIWKNTNALAAQIKEHIGDMITMGKNPGAIKRQLMKDFGVSYDVADRLVTTEASHAFNSAAMERYRQAGVEQVKYLLDPGGNVCDICRGYATDRPNGVYPIDEIPSLPIHPRCHCCYAPVVDLTQTTQAVKSRPLQQQRNSGIMSMNRISSGRFEPMNEQDRDKVINFLRRHGADVIYGGEADEILDGRTLKTGEYCAAGTIGNIILYRTNASASEIIEEAIHFAQGMRELISNDTVELEIEALERMIRKQSRYGITDAENEQNIRNLKRYKEMLERRRQ